MARRRKKQPRKVVKRKPPRKAVKRSTPRKAVRKKKQPASKRTKHPYLKNKQVPNETYDLRFSHRVVDGEMVVGIEADTLKKLVNSFLKRKGSRGVVLARLLIFYSVGLGRGRARVSKVVSTVRIIIDDDDSWQELLEKFAALSLTLHGYDAIELGAEDDADVTIRIDRVVLELIHLVKEPSIDLTKGKKNGKRIAKVSRHNVKGRRGKKRASSKHKGRGKKTIRRKRGNGGSSRKSNRPRRRKKP